MSNVKTYAGENVVKNYQLNYENSTATGRSRINSLSECNAAGTCKSSSIFGWQEDGDGTFSPSPHSIMDRADSNTYMTGDVNGDGLTDLIQVSNTSDLAWSRINNGDGTFSPSPHSIMDRADSNTYMTGDVNGDGLTDLIQVSNISDLAWSRISNGNISDQVIAVTNGFGEQISISYEPLTNKPLYKKCDNDINTCAPSQYPIQDLQSPMYVVSSYGKSNGLDGPNSVYSHSYKYEGAKLHLRGRGFLGFNKVTVTDDQTGIVKETTYRQDFPFAGLVAASVTKQANDNVISSSSNSWIDLYATDSTRFSIQPDSSDEYNYELDTTLVSHVTTSNTYDPEGNVRQIVVNSNDGYVKTTNNTFKPADTTNWILGRLLTASVTSVTPTDTATRSSSFDYDPVTGLLTKEVIEPSNADLELTTTYGYDSYGNKASITVSGHASASYPIVSRTTTHNYDYSALGDITNPRVSITTTNALGHSETKVIDARWGKPTSLTGPNGLLTSWSYDTLGRVIREDRADGTWTTTTYTLCETACPHGSPLHITTQQKGSSPATVYFDMLGREVMSEGIAFDGRTVHKKTEYDSFGRIASVSLPYFASTATPPTHRFGYDVLGRTTSETFPDGSISSVEYKGLTTVYTNDKLQKTTKVKNSQGKLEISKDHLGNSNTYTYDAFGNLKTVTDAAGNVTSMGYDIRGNKTAMNDPDMGAWQYRYNALGKLKWQQDAKLQQSSLEYDVLGRLIKRTKPEGISTWVYDTAANGIGKLASVTGPDAFSRTHTYDDRGRPHRTNMSVGGVGYYMQTAYDLNGRVEQTTYPTGFAVKNVYNTFGYLSEIRNASNNALYWQAVHADASGRVTEHALGNNLTTLHTYDDLTGRMVDIKTLAAGVANVQNLHYVFDTLGNLTSRQNLNQSLSESFDYDGLNRLTTATLTGVGSKTYTYDAIGNITSKSDVGAYLYGQNGAGPHAVTSAGGISYSYDANGNQLTGDGRTLTYTSFNKPLTASKGSVNATFYYDAGHNRIKKVSQKNAETTTTIYLGKAYEEVSKPDVVEYKHYIATGGATVVYTTRSVGSADTRYLHKDHLGSTDVITDETGAVVESLSFDPHGARRNANWTSATGLITSLTTRGFTGHEMDDDIGLINMNARMYDAKLGRFLQPDTYIQFPETTQGFNRYTYVNNNPLSYTDPSGHLFSGLRSFVHSVMGGIGRVVNRAANKVAKKVNHTIKKYGRTIAAIGVSFVPGLNIYAAGFLSGMISSGGDIRAGLFGAFSAGMFKGLHEMTVGWDKVFAHGITGGVMQELQGGSFKAGFLSAGFTQLASWKGGFGMFGKGDTIMSRAKNAFAAATVGGTASKLGGGKFANGAATAAMGYLFGSLANDGYGTGGSSGGKDKVLLDANGNPVISDEITGPFVDGDFVVSSPFGETGSRYHLGVDVVPLNADGSVCQSCSAVSGSGGTVIYAGPATGFGPNTVIVGTPGGNQVIYGHMQGIAPGIQRGVGVSRGQALGVIGNEGRSSGLHLHVEVRQGNVPFRGLRLQPPVYR